MSEENVDVVRRIYEATARRDRETVLSLYHPDAEWDMTHHPYGEMFEPKGLRVGREDHPPCPPSLRGVR